MVVYAHVLLSLVLDALQNANLSRSDARLFYADKVISVQASAFVLQFVNETEAL